MVGCGENLPAGTGLACGLGERVAGGLQMSGQAQDGYSEGGEGIAGGGAVRIHIDNILSFCRV